MPLPKGFDRIDGPPEPRFTERPIPDRPRPPGDFAKDETTAEKARAAHAQLTADLQAKRVRYVNGELVPWPEGKQYVEPVQGDFKPSDFPGHGTGGDGFESVWLEGGPLDGRSAKIRRGSTHHAATAANPDPNGNAFTPADYFRTRRLSNEGLLIFEFKPPVAV